LTHGELGVTNGEWGDDVDHRAGLFGEQSYETPRYNTDHDIDLGGAQPARRPGLGDLGPLLEPLDPAGLRGGCPSTQITLIGHPTPQRTGAFVAPQFVLIEPHLSFSKKRGELIELGS
jgi:hypothetical protein